MPTTASDRRVLLVCAAAIVGGLALIAVGLLLEPPLAVLRHMKA